MGAADVVPGVSGGTIALITGIYEELLQSINAINLDALKVLRKEGFAAFWQQINGSFLLSLFLGIGLSVISLAKLITHWLEIYPIYVWSFFFGLVLASGLFIIRLIDKWSLATVFLFLTGVITAYWITLISPAQGSSNPLYLFLCGACAICAMILPGISGSLILLLLGAYSPIFEAVGNLDFKTLAPVIGGAVIGLALFSRGLSYLFDHYRSLTLAVLAGFVFGALNKVWPWKEVIETYVNRHGVEEPLVERSILPHTYTELTQLNAHVGAAIAFCIAGFAIVFILEQLAKKLEQ